MSRRHVISVAVVCGVALGGLWLLAPTASVPTTAAAPAPGAPSAALAPATSPAAPPAAPPAAATASTAAPPAASAAPSPVVVAIGDSIMSGHGLDDPSDSWPGILAAQNGWQLTNFADDGTGFAQVGDGGDTFQTQVQWADGLDPSIVIVSASNNDLGVDSDELADQTADTMQSLRASFPSARIIALSAFWGDTTPPDELQQATDDLRDAAQAVGADFVDIGQPLAGEPQLMQDDDVHPTADGQRVLAAAIDADIASAIAAAPEPGPTPAP